MHGFLKPRLRIGMSSLLLSKQFTWPTSGVGSCSTHCGRIFQSFMRKGIGKGEWYREVVTMGDINANQPHCVSCNRVGTEFSGKPVESQCFGKNDPGLRWRDRAYHL